VPDIQALLALKTCGIRQLLVDPDAMELAIGQEFVFTAVARDGAGATVPLPRAVRWVLVGAAATDIGGGGVRGAGLGAARLEASIEASGGTTLYCAEARLSVKAASGADVEPRSLTLRAGETATLTATVTDDAGLPLPCADLHWYSGDVLVADVEATGNDTSLVTALAAGEVESTAVCGDAIGAAHVAVYDRITLAPASACLAVGEQLQLTVLASGLPVTGSVTWAAPSGAASVADGLLTGLAEGRASVTATLEAGADALRASALVDVTAAPLCGTWDFTVEEHGTSPRAYVERYPRVASIFPGATPGTFVADWGPSAWGIPFPSREHRGRRDGSQPADARPGLDRGNIRAHVIAIEACGRAARPPGRGPLAHGTPPGEPFREAPAPLTTRPLRRNGFRSGRAGMLAP
jgi:uncharacterized protein YjdB